MKNIVLIGIMGCGKTTVGKLLAEKLNINFVDLDAEIEKDTKMKISDIFSTYGEEYFRNIEEKTAEKFSKKSDLIISAGGGIITKENSINFLKQSGTVIFIQRDLEKIIKNNLSDRPFLKNNPSAIYDIMEKRRKLYEKYSDFSVENDTLPEITAEKIIEIIKKD